MNSKNAFIFVGSALITFLVLLSISHAATPPITAKQGGTGTSTWQTKSIPFFTGFRFTENTGFNFNNAGSLLTVTNATTTALSATVFCLTGDTCRTTWPTGTSLTFTTPLILNGSTVTFSGITTSTAPTIGNLAYWTGLNTLGTVSTSSETCSSPLSCTAHTVLSGGGAITIQNASASQGGAITLNDYQRLYTATTTFSSPLSYSVSTNAVTCPTCNTSNATVSSVATTWPIAGGTITTTGTINWAGLATSSNLTGGQVVAVTDGGHIYSLATSSETCTSPLSCASHVVLTGGGAITIQNASASQGGAITLNDYQRLYTATTTFSAPLSYSVTTNAVTCTNASSGVTGCMSANDWGLLHTATTTFSAPLSYSVTTNAVTCSTCATALGYIPWGGSISTNFAQTVIASTTRAWFQNGLYASSTSQFDYASTTGLTINSGGAFYNTPITSALALFDANHKETAYGGASACSSNNFVTTISAVGGTTCGNSTIGATSPNSTLSFGAAASFGSTFTGDINLAHANTWTALQTISAAGTTTIASGLYANSIAAPYFDATSTSASSTFLGGVQISGGLTVSSIATGILKSVSGAITTALVNLSSDVTGTLGAGNGGTGATSLSSGFTVSSNVFSNVIEHGFDMQATTTAWQAGTTTLHYQVSQAGTLTNISCRVFPLGAGFFLNTQFGTGSASSTMLNASSTANNNAANLSLSAGGTLYIDIGTSTAPAIKDIACTWQERI